jgi:hypothetical protein
MIVTTVPRCLIEDTLRSFFNGKKIDVEKPNGKMLTEMFQECLILSIDERGVAPAHMETSSNDPF